jgi:hypothetical protein
MKVSRIARASEWINHIEILIEDRCLILPIEKAEDLRDALDDILATLAYEEIRDEPVEVKELVWESTNETKESSLNRELRECCD